MFTSTYQPALSAVTVFFLKKNIRLINPVRVKTPPFNLVQECQSIYYLKAMADKHTEQ